MESKIELTKARDEVMRKIGRNVIFYQQMELMLKHIIAAYSLSGYAKDIESSKKKREAEVSQQTMGILMGQFVENTHTEYKPQQPDTIKGKSIYFDINVNIDCDTEYYLERKQSLKAIVDDRNELIHHLLPNFNPNSIESCFETEKYLDTQYDKLLPEHDMLKQFILAAEEELKNFIEYLQSDKFKTDLKLSDLRQNQFVILLAEITEKYSRPDGWTLLNIADGITRKEAREAIISINKQYNFKRLKKLMLATQIFDISEEPTEKGGKRVLYRLKDEWKLSPPA